MKSLKLSVVISMAICFGLVACGGGGDSAEPPVTDPSVTVPPVTEPPVTEPPVTEPPVTEPPVTEPPVTEPPVTEPLEITLVADTDNSAVGLSYNLIWTLSREAECELSGTVVQSVTANGTTVAIASFVGIEETVLTCEGEVARAEVQVIPEYIDIPDPVFASAMNRAGWPVVSGQMRGETALAIDMVFITSFQGSCGEADENGTAVFENTSVPDTGVRCAYTPQNQYIVDTTGLKSFLNMRTIRLVYQKPNSVDITGLAKIELLSLWGTPITTIDLSTNTGIVFLGLSETSLTTVDTSSQVLMEEAAFQQSDTDVPYTTAHGTEVYGFNQLDFSNNVNLKRTYLTSNPLKSFGISQNKNTLREIWASNTDIEILDLSGFTKVNYVILSKSSSLQGLNLTGINYGNVPYRLYLEGVPLLGEVVVDDADSYEQRRNTSGVWIDDHVYFVEAN
jgi:hypothetical protein